MKIRTKLILANLFIVLFLLGTLTYILLKRSSELALDNMIENSALSLSQTSSNLDNKLSSYEEFANMLFLNNTLNQVLQTHNSDDREAYEAYFNIYRPYISAVQATKDIYNVKIFTDNPTFVFDKFTLIDQETASSEWYMKVMNNHTGGYWSAPYLNPLESDPMISFRKRLNNFDPDSKLVVSIEVRLSGLTDLLTVESQNKRFVFTLADGTVLFDSAREHQIAAISELHFADKVAEGKRGSFNFEEGGESYQIMYETLDSHNTVKGMKLISFVPLTELTPRINQLRSLAIILFLSAFVLSAILVSTITVGFTRRITELAYKMKRVHKDNFRSFVEVRGHDEVAQLGDMFNVMVQRLGHLVQEVYQSELDRKELELRTKEVELYALQAQINPHFLFNVLNIIRGKLLISGERENARVVGLLAKSFRVILRKDGQMVPLAEELEFVDIYLQIQQYRLGSKLSYSIEIPEEFRSTLIPKLSIQPLVENAITHGIELSPSPCYLRIFGMKDNGDLLIAVEDNGLGMTNERQMELIKGMAEEDSLSRDAHIGLRNVNRRLRHLYGREYGLLISSEEGAGTTVTLMLPLDE